MSGKPLFVYGTLRRGCSNDIARLVPQARLVSTARVRGILYLVSWYPHLILDPQADWVHGELYEVPTAAWAVLDALEEVVKAERPNGEYFRRETVVQAADGNAVAAMVYEGNPAVLPRHTRIAHGDWARYAVENNLPKLPANTR